MGLDDTLNSSSSSSPSVWSRSGANHSGLDMSSLLLSPVQREDAAFSIVSELRKENQMFRDQNEALRAKLEAVNEQVVQTQEALPSQPQLLCLQPPQEPWQVQEPDVSGEEERKEEDVGGGDDSEPHSRESEESDNKITAQELAARVRSLQGDLACTEGELARTKAELTRSRDASAAQAEAHALLLAKERERADELERLVVASCRLICTPRAHTPTRTLTHTHTCV